ncbi:MAG: LacI family DNA-binding transcriptional regulator [Acidobacteria bacterium]|nr:LacI family DNA-binding transcriptional regulator [Acidobacteriota bacterium]
MAKYTMRDVARLAGVSIATVSAYINGTAGVSERLTAKIAEAMAALDYHPDQVARSLKVGRTQVIGMVVPDVTNAFFPEVIRGVEDAAAVEGYSVILCNSNEDAEQEKRHLSTLFSRRVDGVLLACTDTAAAYGSLIQRRFPIVFLDRIPQGIPHAGVCTDNEGAGHVATRHLIGLGHKRIAFVAGNLRHSPHAERLNGFRKAMQEANIAVRDECLRMGDQSIESGYKAGLEMMRLAVPPTAIIASNNRMLLGLMRAVNELKIRCPQQVSIVGFDDFAWTQHFTPPLTVIAQPAHELGRKAMEMLLGQIRAGEGNETKRFENLRLAGELRVRESTARPPALQLVGKTRRKGGD